AGALGERIAPIAHILASESRRACLTVAHRPRTALWRNTPTSSHGCPKRPAQLSSAREELGRDGRGTRQRDAGGLLARPHLIQHGTDGGVHGGELGEGGIGMAELRLLGKDLV